jgi:hypothetical protein
VPVQLERRAGAETKKARKGLSLPGLGSFRILPLQLRLDCIGPERLAPGLENATRQQQLQAHIQVNTTLN